MSSSGAATELVDWPLARRVALRGLTGGTARMPGHVDLSSSGSRAADAVLAYTRLEVGEPLPEPEWVSRAEWAEINLASMRGMLGLVARRLDDTIGIGAGIAGIARRVLAVELGVLIGFAARHVLGQYEFALLGDERPPRPPRLLFVGENLGYAARQLGGRSDQVLDWVSLHETTHAVHLGSAPWIRSHVGELAETLISEAPVRIGAGEILSKARGLAFTDPRRAIAELRRSDPVSLLAPAATVEVVDSIQATMAAIEGYAEHVMDAAAADLGPAVERLRSGMERRRADRGPLTRLLSWIFGFELKLRQYRDGKRFCDQVVTAAGIEGLNRAWDGPAALPDLAELAGPDAWVRRVGVPPLVA